MTLSLDVAARTHVGLVRTGNEDAGYAGPNLLLIADGMGGQAAGEVASAATVDVVQELDQPLPGTAGDDAVPDPESALRDAVVRAGERLRGLIQGRRELEGMGTTLTALLLAGDRLGVAQVGDSRAYLLRDGELTQITRDQTLVQTLIDSERITDDQARVHPQRNLLLQALDGRVEVEPVVEVLTPRLGDRLLACSDGLSSYSSAEAIHAALATGTPAEAAERLVELALSAGAPDNVTCLVGDVVDLGPDGRSGVAGVRVGAEDEIGLLTAGDAPAGTDATETEASDAPEGETAERSAEADAADGPEGAEGKPRRRGLRWLVVGVVLLLVLVGAAFGAYRWSQSQYYVASSNGQVVIYQGVPRTVAGHKLSHVVQATGIPTDELPTFARDQLKTRITADSMIAAVRIVASLQEQRASCQDEPPPTGCP